ncbi:MAG: peptidoglycan DD-metalloendopeptidase family protein [Leucobacter sp.]
MDQTSTTPERKYPTRRSLREAAARAAAVDADKSPAPAASTTEAPTPDVPTLDASTAKPEPVEPPASTAQVKFPDPVFKLGSVIPSPVSLRPVVSETSDAARPRRSKARRVVGTVAAAASACALFSVMMLPTLAPFEDSALAAAADAQRFTSEDISSSLEAGSLSQLEAPKAELIDSPTSAAFQVDSDAVVQYPVSGSVNLTDGFGPRMYPVSGFHAGQDFAASSGTPVVAMADGTIASSGFINGRCGFGVQIEHEIDNQEVTTLSCHMEAGSPSLSVGDTVAKGDQVGRVGATGLAFGAHLHFEIEVAGEQLDPMPYLALHSKAPTVEAGVPAAEETD